MQALQAVWSMLTGDYSDCSDPGSSVFICLIGPISLTLVDSSSAIIDSRSLKYTLVILVFAQIQQGRDKISSAAIYLIYHQ